MPLLKVTIAAGWFPGIVKSYPADTVSPALIGRLPSIEPEIVTVLQPKAKAWSGLATPITIRRAKLKAENVKMDDFGRDIIPSHVLRRNEPLPESRRPQFSAGGGFANPKL